MRADYISEWDAIRAAEEIDLALSRGKYPSSRIIDTVYQEAFDWYSFFLDQLEEAPESSEREVLERQCNNLVEKIEGLRRLSIESAWRRKDKL
ncbi:MAG: hypothetical protein KJ600_00010 [Nanoarchaeota archaeon]|nr:hypothetical protein [Nanoarchaeota archaeon]MBU1102929.1 hypothetical protein [Nanoarchaeota archaeon]